MHFSVVVLLVCCCVIFPSEAQHWDRHRTIEKTFRGYYGDKAKLETTPTPTNKSLIEPKPKQSGLGLGAWGIVVIILAIILTATGIYYAILFYPILCKKENKYQNIVLTNL